MYLVAILLPPLAVLLCGKPFQAILNFFLTLLFYFPGLIHAILVVSEMKNNQRIKTVTVNVTNQMKTDNTNSEMKKCPFCAEEIQYEAIFCKHCKKDLPPVKKDEKIICPNCKQDPFSERGKLWMDTHCTKCGQELPARIIERQYQKQIS